MQTADDYIQKTESAVRRLFDGIDAYLAVLHKAKIPALAPSEPYESNLTPEMVSINFPNEEQLTARRDAEREFLAESFALDTLCGAVLQVAGKAIEIYSTNTNVPPSCLELVKPMFAKFCVGRMVRNVPLGLIIYAARNQHTHFNDKSLREPSATVFERLATAHGYSTTESVRDPAFDLNNPSLTSYASNVTALIKWRNYDQYVRDMHDLLGEQTGTF